MVRHEVLHLTMYVQLCIALIYSVYPCMYSIHKVVDGPLMFRGILYSTCMLCLLDGSTIVIFRSKCFLLETLLE